MRKKESVRFLAQRTIEREVRTMGIGLHSGRSVEIQLAPAPEDAGIVFERVDLDPPERFESSPFVVGDTRLASTLASARGRVSTVEHLMSACAGLGIDNLTVRLRGEETPILDGSAAPFVYLLASAGVREQGAPKRFWRCVKRVEVDEGDKRVSMSPHEGVSLSVQIAFEHPALRGEAVAEFDMGTESFARKIAPARTFGFTEEVEALREIGLARGGSLSNAIVLDEERIVNHGGLRIDEEFARHKLLDALGDLRLAGRQILGRYEGYKPGHGLNNKLLRALFEQNALESFEFADEGLAPEGLRFEPQTRMV
jgi:UDP-3-O-[3-hydroxymyristoyl] N-acetylglucosamine deacetylase